MTITSKAAAVTCGATLLGTLVIAAPAAQAAPTSDLAAAFEATQSALANPGGSILVTETASKSRDLFGSSIPARSAARYAYRSSGTNYSMAVYQIAGRAILGQWGSNPVEGRWSSLGAAGTWAADFIEDTELKLSTVVTGMDKRLDVDTADGATRSIALALLLPPNTANPDSWQQVRMTPGPNGTTVFRGKAKGRSCTYPSISITVKAGLIRSSEWTSACGKAGRTVRTGTVDYRPGSASGVSGGITQDQAIVASANPSRMNDWKKIASAANATAAAQWSDIVTVVDGMPETTTRGGDVIEALAPVDYLLRTGTTGVVRAFPDGNITRYFIQPAGVTGQGATFSSVQVTVGGDGLIQSIRTTSTRTGENVTTFVP